MVQIISLVVAMNQERVIGTNNTLPWHIPEDLAYFKQVTLGKPIVMGRKTFESIGKALPQRKNIVISRQNLSYPDVEVFNSLSDAINSLRDEPEICIIGGGELFSQALELANSLHITMVDYPVADPCAWFPQIDLDKWELVSQHSIISKNGITCKFNHYIVAN